MCVDASRDRVVVVVVVSAITIARGADHHHPHRRQRVGVIQRDGRVVGSEGWARETERDGARERGGWDAMRDVVRRAMMRTTTTTTTTTTSRGGRED